MNTRLALAALPAALVLLLAGCAQDTAMEKPATPASAMEKPSAMASDAMTDDGMAKAGAYLTLADYQAMMDSHAGSTVVYFFHASWCPDCKAADMVLAAADAKIPAGVTIVKVDYDTQTELKQKYGVTMQHTYVRVDADGRAVKTWIAKSVDTVLADLAG